jgi:hypothetical protein
VIFITGGVKVQLDPVCCEIVKVTAVPAAALMSNGNPRHTESAFIEAVAASKFVIVIPP